jgi:K+-sensing histidine kinase KdpD
LPRRYDASVRDDLGLAVGYITAGLGPLAAVAVLSVLREQPLSTGIVVLVLVSIIVAAAVLAGPVAGLTATLTAALSFDFLFIPPYRVLKVGATNEFWPVILLLVFGVAIVSVVRRSWRTHCGSTATPTPALPNSSRHVQRVALLVDQGADVRDLVAAVQAELTGLLLVRSCRFDAGHDASARPRLERDGTVSGCTAEDDILPGELEIPVRIGRHRVGRFVVEPNPGVEVPLEHRIVAVIMTDHLAAAIANRKPTAPPRR